MKIVALSDHIGVSEQISPDDVAEIVAAGYRVLVNNRPDGEAVEQPSSAAIEAAASAAGIEYHYLPVTAKDFPGADASEMARLFADPEKPVLAFCRTGTRCTNLWVATRALGEEQDSARQQARALGYDLAMSSPKS